MLRGHEAGHFDGSETGQPFAAAADITAGVAATADDAVLRGHEAGHCDGSETGQPFAAADITAGVAAAVVALIDER